MSDLPPIAIGMVTYKRTSEAITTINSTCMNLDYPRELRRWYIADDGSPGDHVKVLLDCLTSRGELVLGSTTERLRLPGEEDTYHSGRVWNRGLGICHQFSDFVLWLEDDWRLDERLDLRPYIKLLADLDGTKPAEGDANPKVGLISFRVLSVGSDLHSVGYDGIHYLKYLRTTPYAYSGNPHLRHARFTSHYGWFAESSHPGEIELDMDSRYRADDTGPDIWRPAMINPWGAWGHIGTDKAYVG